LGRGVDSALFAEPTGSPQARRRQVRKRATQVRKRAIDPAGPGVTGYRFFGVDRIEVANRELGLHDRPFPRH